MRSSTQNLRAIRQGRIQCSTCRAKPDLAFDMPLGQHHMTSASCPDGDPGCLVLHLKQCGEWERVND